MVRRRSHSLTISRRGVTLMELMISVSVMAVILAAVLVLQLQGLRIYQDVAANDRASFQAASAIELIESDIKQSFRVIGRYSDRITLSIPLTHWDTNNQCYVATQPLTHGDSVRYYLSDETGAMGTSGKYLWRAVKSADSSSYVRGRGPLANGITTLRFTYAMAPSPRHRSVRRIGLLVQAESKERGTTRVRTHTAEIVLRNAGYGPVTRESGADPI